MKMIINGKKTDSECGLTFDIINPATGEVIDTVPKATEKDVISAIDAAEKGQKIWADTPVWQRAQVLYKFLDIVDVFFPSSCKNFKYSLISSFSTFK